jgi:hypothetical protein
MSRSKQVSLPTTLSWWMISKADMAPASSWRLVTGTKVHRRPGPARTSPPLPPSPRRPGQLPPWEAPLLAAPALGAQGRLCRPGTDVDREAAGPTRRLRPPLMSDPLSAHVACLVAAEGCGVDL